MELFRAGANGYQPDAVSPFAGSLLE